MDTVDLLVVTAALTNAVQGFYLIEKYRSTGL